MSRRSLLARLGCAAALLIALALAVGGAGLTLIFDRQMERRAAAELGLYAKALAAQLRIGDGGRPELEAVPAEPRFDQPYSGLYWQIDTPAGRSLRSRSLWDYALPARPGQPGEAPVRHRLDGPEHAALLAVSRTIVTDDAPGAPTATITVALDYADLAAERRSFLELLVPALAGLGLLLALAMAGLLYLALRPFRGLRADLQAIHAGRRRTLSRDVPDEVQPVVDDLNRLIAFQDAALERACAQAGDLAHGLKTPLAVLGAMARDARRQGQPGVAGEIEGQVDLMRHHVERALARARAGMTAAVGRRATADVGRTLASILRALRTLPDAQALRWEVALPSSPLRFAGDDGDLTEILGNLLDNARKWARRHVRVSADGRDGHFTLTIEDDGPGLPDDVAVRIERGRRWDESRPGSGFGLAIARDLAEAYQGSLGFSRSPLGGLAVAVSLPAAPSGNAGRSGAPSSK
ncbi:HAMP domain-containing sensor histidine kinase [Pigmentiphaga soli]|uniref:histidine kinase n=1 Tax=Pigmentiphaga soli TaxID=1007095 RepID=A0ABP8GPH6_9BURK